MYPNWRVSLAVVIGGVTSAPVAAAFDCSSHQHAYADLTLSGHKEYIGCDMSFDKVQLNSDADVDMSATGRIVLTNFTTQSGARLNIRTNETGATFMAAQGNNIKNGKPQDWGPQNFLSAAAARGWPTLDIDPVDHIARNIYDFYDSTVTAAGTDTAPGAGFDAAFVVYMGAHGDHSPSTGKVRFAIDNLAANQLVYPHNMRLGNLSNDGLTRYFFLDSCNVFRHGPKYPDDGNGSCNTSRAPYLRPHHFDGGSSDPLNADPCKRKANVYENIGPMLGDSMRMACGMTTTGVVNASMPSAFWNRLSGGKTVADAFLFSFRGYEFNIPMCITTGGSDINKTPLVTDTDFDMASNPSGDYYHIRWRVAYSDEIRNQRDDIAGGDELTGWQQASGTSTEPNLPEELALVEVEPTVQGPVANFAIVDARGPRLHGRSVRLGRTVEAEVDQRSGGFRLWSRRAPVPERWTDDGRVDYVRSARRAVSDWNAGEADIAAGVTVSKLQTQRVPRNPAAWNDSEIVNSQDGVVVQFRRRLVVDGRAQDVVGDGGTLEVRLNNDGTFAGMTKTWRKRVRQGQERHVRTKRFSQALSESQARLGAGWTLKRWRIGYKEDDSSAEQRELRPVYELHYTPPTPEQPELIVEVSAEAD
jgi:hypothetical protein